MKRVSAPQIEKAILAALRPIDISGLDDQVLVAEHLSRATVSEAALELSLIDGDVVRLPSPRRSSGRQILATTDTVSRPMKTEARAVLLRWIALGRKWIGELTRTSAHDLDRLAKRHGCTRRHVERMISYAFLAPDIVRAVAEGRLPRGVNARALADAPILWTEQWRAIGLDQPVT